jgi:hypothetical protein
MTFPVHIDNIHMNAHILERIYEDWDRYDPFLREIVATAPVAFGEIKTVNPDGSPQPVWRQGFFTWLDALSLCAVLRHRNPRTYLEIGSGNSTRFARWCINRFGLRTRIVSIDPSPRTDIKTTADAIYKTPVQEAPPDLFYALSDSDILFYDGSHKLGKKTDMSYVCYHVLPSLNRTVLIGMHDTYLPLLTHNTEDYFVGALLLGGNKYRVDLPGHYLASIDRRGRQLLLPLLDTEDGKAIKSAHQELYSEHGKNISGDMHSCSFYFSRAAT